MKRSCNTIGVSHLTLDVKYEEMSALSKQTFDINIIYSINVLFLFIENNNPTNMNSMCICFACLLNSIAIALYLKEYSKGNIKKDIHRLQL